MLGRTDSRVRLLFLLLAFVIASTALVARLAWWQVVRRDALAEQARMQTSLRVEVASPRGAIYDRSGVVVLATTVIRDRLVAAADKLTAARRREMAVQLATILDLDPGGEAALLAKLVEGRQYVVLARGLEPATSQKIRDAIAAKQIAQVSLEPEPTRVYPQSGGGPDSTLAAHLLGFVNRDGVGQYGVEQRYQAELAGSPKVVYAQKDVIGRPVLESSTVADPGTAGTDIRLTIDAGLQYDLEQELFGAWLADDAKKVSAVVMDPYTGEIYAEATYPSYNGNDYKAIASSDAGRFVDPVVSEVYEPGSVFKMLTAVAGFESGTVEPSTRIKDVGTLWLDDHRAKIDDADRKGMGWMTFEDAIAYSRNVVASKVALKLANTTSDAAAKLHEVWTRFGFGNPTGVDVSGEVRGIVSDPAERKWRQIDLANGSFGQGVAVTPIQLATAFAAMANGGHLVQPHVVQAVGDRDLNAPSRGDVIAPALSSELVKLMNHVVTEVPFYRDRTLIPGYDVGGKTGTAQIWDAEKGRWKINLFNYSFIGYIAREAGRPDLVVAVRISEGRPSVARVGHLEMPVMSFELFRRIALDAITTPGLLPERRPAPVPATAHR
ncbi:MAG: peptidoglycan D,D-transpeptidase FtsI family protein [Chloroflexota bacterium]